MTEVGAQVPHFLPNFPYFYKMFRSDIFVVADHLSFRKQSPIVRARLGCQRTPVFLSIPCVHQTTPHPRLREVRLAETENWRRKHLRTLISQFSGFPFFEYYFPEIRDIYKLSHSFLLDFLRDILEWQLKVIFPRKEITFSSDEKISTNLRLKQWINRAKDPALLIYPEEASYYRQNFPEFRKKELSLSENISWPAGYEPSLPFLIMLFLKGPESAAFFGKSQNGIRRE